MGKFSNAAAGKSQSFSHNLKEVPVTKFKTGREEVVCGITYFCAFPTSLGSITIHWGNRVCTAAFIEFAHFSHNNKMKS